jgi:uncharacterized protein YbjT (DUF2867 family)
MNQTLLLAGATGMLGSQIAQQLLKQPASRLRLLVREGQDASKRAVLEPLLAGGAEVVEGELADAASLDRATRGVDVIVSAVQGGADVIVAGQVALAEAGRRNGVRRILPSDFALDLFNATPGEHALFDMRRQAAQCIVATGLEVIHVLQGGFMEMFTPGVGMFDSSTGVVSFWGDGSERFEVTSVADTARMTARIALDRGVAGGKFSFAGDRISFRGTADVIEKQTGRRFELRSLGTEADLRAAMAAAAKDKANTVQTVMLAYQLYMLNGQTALSDLQNDRYADVRLETFTDFVSRTSSP